MAANINFICFNFYAGSLSQNNNYILFEICENNCDDIDDDDEEEEEEGEEEEKEEGQQEEKEDDDVDADEDGDEDDDNDYDDDIICKLPASTHDSCMYYRCTH